MESFVERVFNFQFDTYSSLFFSKMSQRQYEKVLMSCFLLYIPIYSPCWQFPWVFVRGHCLIRRNFRAYKFSRIFAQNLNLHEIARKLVPKFWNFVVGARKFIFPNNFSDFVFYCNISCFWDTFWNIRDTCVPNVYRRSVSFVYDFSIFWI